MRPTRSLAFLLALAAIVALGTFGLTQLHREEPDALGLAPTRTAFVVEVNIEALKRAPWIARAASDSAALRRLREDCGASIDAIQRVRGYLLLNDAGQLAEVVASAHGTFALEELTQCVARANEGMGSALHETEIEGTPALASDQGTSVAAPLGEHGVMTGPATAVASSLRQLAGETASADAAWRPLWEGLQTRRDVRVVGTLPEDWRSFFGQRPRGDAHRPEHIAIGISLEHGVDAEASLAMPNEDDARSLASDIAHQLEAWRAREEFMRSALRPALMQTEARSEGAHVHVSLRLSETETIDALLLVRTLLN
jgi:hypothetical protein